MDKQDRNTRLSMDEARRIVALFAGVITALRNQGTSTKHIVAGLASAIIMTAEDDPYSRQDHLEAAMVMLKAASVLSRADGGSMEALIKLMEQGGDQE